MQEPLSILSVCWYKIYPAYSGGQTGITKFNDAIAAHVPFTCICSANNILPQNANMHFVPVLSNSKMQFLQWKYYKAILQQIKLYKPSILLIENPYYFLLHIWKRKYTYSLWIHTHNIEYLRAKQNGKWFWPLIKIAERLAYRKAEKIICKTKEDANLLQQVFKVDPKKIFLFPYCTVIAALPSDTKESKAWLQNQYGLTSTTKIFLFAGSFNYGPNQQALLHFIRDIFPILKKQFSYPFKIFICGWELETFLTKNRITLPDDFIAPGFVPDIDLYFKAADIFINPVLNGQGMQTKNIDALANNCSVVGYDTVSNGMPEDLIGKKIFLSQPGAPENFVANIHKALEKREATPESFYEAYNWGKCSRALLSGY